MPSQKQSRQPHAVNDVIDPNFLDLRPPQPVSGWRSDASKLLARLGNIVTLKRGVAVLAAAMIVSLAAMLMHHALAFNPVPSAVRHSVNFALYWPDPHKLPAGYTLDTKSFSSNGQAVIYTVWHAGQRLVFTVQAKPSSDALQSFYANHLPLHTDTTTGVGTAAIGGLNNQTVVSLPTTGNAWLLITIPLHTSQAELQQVLKAVRKG